MAPKSSSKTPKKEEKAKKPPKSKEGKAKKKKWSKGKVRDRLNNIPLFNQETYEKFVKEVPFCKLITPSSVSERLKIRASLARHALAELQKSVMRVNSDTCLVTPRLALVPYCRYHVERYHGWMQSELLRSQTSSELLSLEEEYEGRKQWFEASDRLTFILLDKKVLSRGCLTSTSFDLDFQEINNAEIKAMIGDVNLFIQPSLAENDCDNPDDVLEGELSVMIAEERARGRGLACEAMAALLSFSADNLCIELSGIVSKVSLDNHASIHLFKDKLNFVERARSDVFSQVELIPTISKTITLQKGHGNSFLKSVAKQMIEALEKGDGFTWSMAERPYLTWRASGFP